MMQISKSLDVEDIGDNYIEIREHTEFEDDVFVIVSPEELPELVRVLSETLNKNHE